MHQTFLSFLLRFVCDFIDRGVVYRLGKPWRWERRSRRSTHRNRKRRKKRVCGYWLRRRERSELGSDELAVRHTVILKLFLVKKFWKHLPSFRLDVIDPPNVIFPFSHGRPFPRQTYRPSWIFPFFPNVIDLLKINLFLLDVIDTLEVLFSPLYWLPESRLPVFSSSFTSLTHFCFPPGPHR